MEPIWNGIAAALHFVGLGNQSFAESVTASLAATVLVSVASLVVGPRVWRALQLRLRTARIRKAAGNGFVLVRCPIENDTDDAIGGEIAARIEEAFQSFAGPDEHRRPFEVISLPITIGGDEGSAGYEAALSKARKWLTKTNGDVLIWGRHIRNGSVGVIRIIGRNRQSKSIETRRIDFDVDASRFDDALASAIAVEMASLKSVVMQEPDHVRLDHLRHLIDKFDRLAESRAPALNESWRTRMIVERDRLKAVLIRRAIEPSEIEHLERETRGRLSVLSSGSSDLGHEWAEVALQIAILVRKEATLFASERS